MNALKRRLTPVGNRVGTRMYRAFRGRLSSGSKDVHALMITTPGRRTGFPHSTCVRYLDTPTGLVVWGTRAGSPRDQDWFQNLRKAMAAQVQIGRRRLQTRARELVGTERDLIWNEVVLAQIPNVAKYARRAGRTIPVAILEPIAARHST